MFDKKKLCMQISSLVKSGHTHCSCVSKLARTRKFFFFFIKIGCDQDRFSYHKFLD